MENQTPNPNDHDILIELRTQVRDIRTDLREVKDGLSTKVALLEEKKVDKSEFSTFSHEYNSDHKDHESRLRTLETVVLQADARYKEQGERNKSQIRNWGIVLTVISVIINLILGLAH